VTVSRAGIARYQATESAVLATWHRYLNERFEGDPIDLANVSVDDFFAWACPAPFADVTSEALDAIQLMLRDPEWGVGMLEDIAEIVQRTGRSTDNLPGDPPTWARH
jgi:hypothetical protein